MTKRTALLTFLSLLLLGTLLRAVEAFGTSLWLDEYHTLWVADVDSFPAVVERIERDFHPPLFYWLLSFLRDVDPKLQRLLPLLLSLLTSFPLLGLARAAGLSTLERLVVVGLFLLLPYQIHYAVELRAYSALQLAGCTMAWAVFTTRAAPASRLVALILAAVLGLYAHYFAGVFLLLIVSSALLLRPSGTLSRRALLAGSTLACLAFLPWIVSVEGWLLEDPGRLFRAEAVDTESSEPSPSSTPAVEEPPRETRPNPRPPWWKRDWQKALQVPFQLLVPNLSTLAGSVEAGTHAAWRVPLIRAASYSLFALTGIALLFSIPSAFTRRRKDLPGTAWALFAFGMVSLVLLTLLLMVVWKSVRLQYYSVLAWFLPLAIGLFVRTSPTKVRGFLAIGLLSAAGVAGFVHASAPSREDLESGLRIARSLDEKGNAIFTALLWQPPWYPHAMPYTYARFEGDVREPSEVPGGEATDRPVLLLTRTITMDGPRKLPRRIEILADGQWTQKPLLLLEGRAVTRHVQVDHATHVFLLERRR